MAEWYYVQGGQQLGPVSGSQLKALAAGGSISREDLVWNQSLPEWTPAGRIRGLMFGEGGEGGAVAAAPGPVAPAHEPAPLPEEMPTEEYETAQAPAAETAAAPLAYRTAGGDDAVPVTQQTVEFLRQTKPWVRLVSILMFIGAGFLVLAGVAAMFLGTAGSMMGGGRRASVGVGAIGMVLGLVYLALAALYIFPAIFLSRYASRIGDLTRSGRSVDLEAALAAQRSFWRFMGIAILIGIGVYLIAIVVAVAGAIR